MTKNQKFVLLRILIAGICFILGFILHKLANLQISLFILSYLIIGLDVVWHALKNIARGKIFDEHFLMTIATLGAFCLKDFAEAAAVMLFYQIGEFFQDYAVDRSRESITELMDLRAEYATIKQGKDLIKVTPDTINVGDTIIIQPGDRVPLDGKVLSGESFMDTSALTGESVPRHVKSGEEILSGYINQKSVLEVEVTNTFQTSTATRILELVEHTSSQKAKAEHFITKFAKVYTPFVVLAAALLAVLPPIFTGQSFAVWVERALTFLVISCPCALVVSIPLGFFAGIGTASKHGILIKGGNYLEALSRTEIAVFDKTGTLTKGIFTVLNIIPANGFEKEEVLEAAAYAEGYSKHPIAQSILDCYAKPLKISEIQDAQELSGHGTSVYWNGQEILAGNDKLMNEKQILFSPVQSSDTVVYIAKNGQYMGCIEIGDEVKTDSKKAIEMLKKLGVKHTVILTGDNEEVGRSVADNVGVDQVYTKLLPEDKVACVEALLQEKGQKKSLIFIGDGMNDAPVLAQADVGIAMGGIGSDAAIEAADAVLMTDEPSKIADALYLAKKTVQIVAQNIIFAIGIKFIILLLGAFGYASMWAAVFADVGVAFLAILNALRILKQYGNKKTVA